LYYVSVKNALNDKESTEEAQVVKNAFDDERKAKEVQDGNEIIISIF